MPGLRKPVPVEPLTTSSRSTLYGDGSALHALAGTLYVKVWLLPRYEPVVRERVDALVGRFSGPRKRIGQPLDRPFGHGAADRPDADGRLSRPVSRSRP
ncbi:hypothetical protein GCM10010282_09330 [Streptomyces roseolus]|nr:hypothetical protein GCM10010282_09330 [Streptomyces roseolus]